MLIAEDLVLLLVESESGKFVTKRPLDGVLAGALLFEAAISGAGDDALLAEAASDSPAEDALATLAPGLGDRVLARLTERGALTDDGATIGVFTTSSWRVGDTEHVEGLRSRLSEVLVEGEDADDRSAALICLLAALDVVHRVVEAPDRGLLSMRAAHVPGDTWDPGSRAAEVAAAVAAESRER